MLEKLNLEMKIPEAEIRPRLEALEVRLMELQRVVLDQGLPVLIAVDGGSAAGKGRLINDLTQCLDPRGFAVFEGRAGPQDVADLAPFWRHSPAPGRIAIFDRSWLRPCIEQSMKAKRLSSRHLRDALAFEEAHQHSGVCIIKVFLHISRKEQGKRFKELRADKTTAWRVTESDLEQNLMFPDWMKAADAVLRRSTPDEAPWKIIVAMDHCTAQVEFLETVATSLEAALARPPRPKKADTITLPPLELASPRATLDLKLRLADDSGYRKRCRKLQDELATLSLRLHREKIPVVLAFEGWDAAGKGGAIKRVTDALDPRQYRVIPVGAPSKEEIARNYLWRFWRDMPSKGRIAIFDRTWYGRVMVERIEGFCAPDDWRRAFDEINATERHLAESGAVVLKFWLEITPEEQALRFKKRQDTPHKQWKITDEDWRNRDKWHQYETAVDELLIRTHQPCAPWICVPAVDKKLARLQVLDTLVKALRKRLGKG